MTSPEKDPIKHLQDLTTKAGETLGDDAAFDATVREINDRLVVEEVKRLDTLIGITKQYESQVAVLRNVGIMTRLPDGSEGIIGEDGTQYPIPSLLSMVQRFCEDEKKYELLRRKVEQGFTKLLLVPFGLPLQAIREKYAEQLKLHKAASKLFAESDQATWLELDADNPVSKWDEYDSQEMAYFPTSFDPQNHGGLSKADAVAQKGAWQVYLVEETRIPGKDKGATKNGRKQLEADLTPLQYLEMLKSDSQYKGEVGLTPELWLMKALTRLEEKNEVIDDCQGKGSFSYNLGAYFPESSGVASAYWNRNFSKAILSSTGAAFFAEGFGVSSAVEI